MKNNLDLDVRMYAIKTNWTVSDEVVFFFVVMRHFPFSRFSSGERSAFRSSLSPKSRNFDEAVFAGGEQPESTAPPAKPSLTGGAGPPHISQLQPIFRAGKNFIAG